MTQRKQDKFSSPLALHDYLLQYFLCVFVCLLFSINLLNKND